MANPTGAKARVKSRNLPIVPTVTLSTSTNAKISNTAPTALIPALRARTDANIVDSLTLYFVIQWERQPIATPTDNIDVVARTKSPILPTVILSSFIANPRIFIAAATALMPALRATVDTRIVFAETPS